MNKSALIAATVGLMGVLVVPATAGAQQGVIPPVRGTVDPCASVTADFRQTITSARAAKQAALRAAQAKFHAATSDERTQVQSASRARKSSPSYRVTTADERAERDNTRSAARAAYKNAARAAKAQLKVGLAACR